MRTWILTILLTFFVTPLAQAHPHVFITPKATIIMSNHFVSQINVEWDFDAMSSTLFLESSGSDPEEIWKMVFPDTQVLENGRQVARTTYYTNVELDGNPAGNLTPSGFNADFVDGILRCQFTLLINQNVDSTIKIWFDDPTIYNAFDVQRGNFQVSDQSGTSHVLQKQNENDIDKICLTF